LFPPYAFQVGEGWTGLYIRAQENQFMSQVLMPKATAVWLVDNTSLTFDQIAESYAEAINGLIDGGYDTVNIIAKSVVARGGGRGIFSVSGSGAARIDRVDLQGTENNSILLENAHNVAVGNATQQSRIADSGQLRIAGTSSDIKIQNIAVSGTTIAESPCATNSTWTSVNGAPTNCN